MLTTVLSIIASVAASIAGVVAMFKNKQMEKAGQSEQLASDMQASKQADLKNAAIRDQAFNTFDSAARTGSLPNDIKLRD